MKTLKILGLLTLGLLFTPGLWAQGSGQFGSSGGVVTGASVSIAVQSLTGCNTAGFVFTPQASDCVAAGGGGSAFPVTVSGTVTSGGIPCFSSTTVEQTSIALTINVLPKGGGAGACPTNSSATDNGTTFAVTEPFTTTGSVSTGAGCTPAGATATGGICMTEAAATGWTPTAGFDYMRADSTSHNILCSFNGGAEISCSPNVYATQSSASTGNISAVSMVASTGAMHDYLFTWTISLTVVGVACTGNATVTLNVIFTDPNSSTPTTQALGTVTIASQGVGTLGFIASGVANILAKTGTAVQYSTSNFTPGLTCTTYPTYQVSPTLVQQW
jgi:hypothetical protein